MDVVSASRSLVGESPIWSAHDRAIYWSDLRGLAVRRLAPMTGDETAIAFPEPVAAPFPLEGGRLAALLASGLFLSDGQGGWRRHARPPDMGDSQRFNDATVDPAGRLIAGTMLERGQAEGPPGRLYLYDGQDWRCLAEGFRTINGLAFSPDGRRLYMSDSHVSVSRVWVADYNPVSGVLGERRTFAVLDPAAGRPDGAATDAEGGYWIAGVGGARVSRFLPDGTLDRVVAAPVRFPTKIAFGGNDRATAYVTSMIAPEPVDRTAADGALFAFPAPVAGCPVPPLRRP